ncbi:MAG: GEVED domain-containing protein, partial [Planctomycetaceae bacterium]
MLRGLLEFDLSALVAQLGGQPFNVEGATLVLTRAAVGNRNGIGENHPVMTLEANLYGFDFDEQFAAWAHPSAISGSDNGSDATPGGTYSTVVSSASFDTKATLASLPEVSFADSPEFRTAIGDIIDGGGTLRLLVRAADAIEQEPADGGFDSHFARFDTEAHATESRRPKLAVSLSAPEAIAVIGVDDSNGAWQYSTDGGSNWIAFGSATPASARLLGPSEQIRFVPDPGFSGTATFTFRAWDQTSGTAGGTADTTANGGNTAFSMDTDTASITVSPPTAPVLDATKSPELNAILKDSSGGSGNLVKDFIVDGSITDPNVPQSVTFQQGSTNAGAVTIRQWTGSNLDGTVNQDGSNQIIIGFNEPTSNIRELLRGLLEFDLSTLVSQLDGQPFNVENASLTLHRSFVGNTRQGTGENHPSMTLEARLYDFDFHEAFATWADPSKLSATTNDGDATPGGTLSTILSTASFDVEASLASLPEVSFTDSAAFRAAIAALLTGGDTLRLLLRATDAIESEPADPAFDSHFVRFDSDDHAAASQRPKLNVSLSAPKAIAVTGVDNTNGAWQYSTNGGASWIAFGSPTPATARLLGPADQVRFVPNAGFTGTSTFTFRAWDQTSGTAGGTADASTGGGNTAFSTSTDTASINVVSLTAPDVLPWKDFNSTPLDSPIVIRTASQPVGTSASVITTADTVLVDLGYLNNGNAGTGVSYRIEIQLDGNAPVGATIGPHNSGSGSFFSGISFGTLSAGTHTLTSTADVLGQVAEGVESNNIFTRTFIVEAVGTADFGDAPSAAQSGFASSYPTLIADGGASHTVVAGFRLGTSVDTETDGRASLMAIDDDQIGTGADDENGVTINGALVRGSAHSFDVSVTNTAGLGSPYLTAWVDFNQDGDWTDPGERVFAAGVAAGTTNVSYLVPASAVPGQSYARFRLHNGTTALTPGGSATEGEVEDYLVEIQAPGNWIGQGPAPVVNGQIENVSPQNRVTGAVHTLLAHPTDANILYAG